MILLPVATQQSTWYWHVEWHQEDFLPWSIYWWSLWDPRGRYKQLLHSHPPQVLLWLHLKRQTEEKCVSGEKMKWMGAWKTARACAYIHKPVYFPLASAWETNPYSKSLNRQLSVVSGHKNLCNLWESGNKTINCWREHETTSLYPTSTASPHKNFLFINQNTSMPCGTEAEMVKESHCCPTRQNDN